MAVEVSQINRLLIILSLLRRPSMEASGSRCKFATTQETLVSDQVSDEDPDPHPACGLGAILLMNLPGVTLA